MKKLAIIGLVLLLLGAALFGAGWYVTGGNLSVLNGRVGKVDLRFDGRKGFSGVRGEQREPEKLFAEKRYDFSPAELEKLFLTERETPLRVTVSPDRMIHLLCQENEDYCFDIKNEGGVLRLERRDTEMLSLVVFGRDWDGASELQLPPGLDAALSLECKNESMTLEGLRLDAQATLEAASQNGRIEARGLSAGKITLASENGRVEAADLSASDSIKLESENGRVEAEGVSAAQLTAKSQNGSVSLVDCTAGDSLTAHAGNGSLNVDGISAGRSIRLESRNGGIKGTLAGSIRDYTVTASAQNGSSSLPERYGRGDVELQVKSTNGSIKLEFAED